MNRKAIQKVLCRKHEQFCVSIKDENVRAMVKKNSFITGGSIVSMLLNEKIRDFDYYFRDKDTAIAVARYYCAEFIRINPENGIEPEVEVDENSGRVKIFIKSAGMVAGEGYEASTQEQQEAELCAAVDEADETAIPADEKYRPVFLSANAITLSDKVQLVIRFYGSPEEVHKNYDFIHCTNYWTAWDGKLVLNPAALESIMTRHLLYTGSLYPICSVIRTRKFLKRGWYINAGQYLKMCFQISELNLTDLNVLEEQLTGVDAAYFHQIIAYCRERTEKEPDFKVTAPYLATIIDKIF